MHNHTQESVVSPPALGEAAVTYWTGLVDANAFNFPHRGPSRELSGQIISDGYCRYIIC